MKKLLSLITILTLFSGANVFAQGCEEPADDGGTGGARVIGFLQSQYEFHFSDNDATPDVNESENYFKFKRARLGVAGNVYEDFSYYVIMEMSPFVSSTGSPYLLDAFVSYKRFQWATISFGSFKQPFGQEVNTSCSGLYTVNRAFVSDYIVTPQRDLGVMLLGGTNETFVKYSLAVMNGQGVLGKDLNDKKDIIGRVTVKPLPYLRVGGSFRNGYPTTNDDVRTSYAGEVEFHYGNIRAQGEYIYDEGSMAAGGGGCGATDVINFGDKRSGYYFMAMYMTPFNIEPIVKYDVLDPDLDDAINDVSYSTVTVGFNYFFNDKVRLQANYGYRAESNDAGTAEKPNDEFLLQVQVKF